MSQNAAATPPPLSQNIKTSVEFTAAENLLRLYKWIPESFNFTNCKALMMQILEKAEHNIKGVTVTTTSQAKKKDWEIMQAATLGARNTFVMKWEHQAFNTMAKQMEGQFDDYFQTKGAYGSENLYIGTNLLSPLIAPKNDKDKEKEGEMRKCVRYSSSPAPHDGSSPTVCRNLPVSFTNWNKCFSVLSFMLLQWGVSSS
ncbi:hypothetical protein BT96DRAFT_932715 [Gymnopus androsaceus JB14]|uniref:Uncharacterized protein n=1 Tax=Gymnopus androsaceus JB14 TaxID=1447944 RepID=A0A6A4IIL3_9AGAR|nr:hypothetical protein BT96DRAFT_932715 [Gymnopus androsaceus JB14]